MSALTTRIKVRDAQGRIIEEKEVATYAGVLARAHEEGLVSVVTELVQIPHPDNGFVAIVIAKVETAKGTFTGIGDASEHNVTRKIVPHLIRMAETRAKVRALRDAVNIGTVSLEELGGGFEEDGEASTPVPAPPPPPPNRRDNVRPLPVRPVPSPDRRPVPEARAGRSEPDANRGAPRPMPMTENQRRLLFRMLAEQGFEGDAATDALCRAAEVETLRAVTKDDASRLIDAWKREGEAAHG
jgi:hypothetical protein